MGGRFAEHPRIESELALAPPPEWEPSDTDFAEASIPLPRSYRQFGEDDENDDAEPDDEYVGRAEHDFWAAYGEQRWFGTTLAGGS